MLDQKIFTGREKEFKESNIYEFVQIDEDIVDLISSEKYSILSKIKDPVTGFVRKDRKWGFIPRTYYNCFVGSNYILFIFFTYFILFKILGNEAVDWLITNKIVPNRQKATQLGKCLVHDGYIIHVCDDHGLFSIFPPFFLKKNSLLVDFEDAYYFYKFVVRV